MLELLGQSGIIHQRFTIRTNQVGQGSPLDLLKGALSNSKLEKLTLTGPAFKPAALGQKPVPGATGHNHAGADIRILVAR